MTSKLLFITKDKFEGPWLLDGNSLRKLDEIISEQWVRLEKRRRVLLEEAVNEEFPNYFQESGEEKTNLSSDEKERIKLYRENHIFSKNYKQFHIYYEDARYECDCFETAIKERSLVGKNPLGFSIIVSSGDIESVISVSKENGLEINVKPEQLPDVQEFYMALWHWADDNEPIWWQRLWWILANMGFNFYLYLCGIPFFLWVVLSLLQQNSTLIETQRKIEALLASGVTSVNMAEGVKLLLEIQLANRISFIIQPWMKVLFIGIVVLGIVVRIRPLVVLGIGKGIKYLRIWRIWMKIIGVTIPTLLFGSFVWPLIEDFVKGFFGTP